MASLQNPWIKGVLLLLLAGAMTVLQANFIGDITIYSLGAAETRELAHERILENKRPEAGWTSVGENGVNIRIGIPYLVEFLHQATGITILRLYKGVDLLCMWLSFIALFLFLRRWFTSGECLLACMYFAAIAPLTFAYHKYHPWDRASFAAWLLATWAARDRHFAAFWAITIVAVLIKYDAIVLPALYLLANLTRENWRKVLVQSFVVGATLLAIFFTLRVVLPGGFEPRDAPAMVLRNIGYFARNPFSYAPSLAFALPLLLAAAGYMSSDRFMRASLWFAGLVTVPLLMVSNFEEVRAEQMLFPLLAPAALLGFRRIVGEPSTAGPPPVLSGRPSAPAQS